MLYNQHLGPISTEVTVGTPCVSVCELLILKLQNPSIIIIIIYRMPSCLHCDFNDVISRAEQYIVTIPAALPNIILLGDFNFVPFV